MDYNPWGHKESDMTEPLSLSIYLNLRKWQPTPVLLPRKFHGWRSLVGYSPWNSPGQKTRVGSLYLLQGIFPTQELNQGLLHCTQSLYQLSHQGSPHHTVSLFVNFWGSSLLFSTVAIPVYIPSTLHNISLFSTCLPAFVLLAFWWWQF